MLTTSTIRQEDSVRIVTIGSLKLTLAAFITLLSGVVLALGIALLGGAFTFVSLYVLLLFVVIAYNVNCAQVGHCKVWAWFLTIVYVVYASIFTLAILTNKESIKKVFASKFLKKGGKR
jgi:hypothetical protein